jgi:RHS repeat-associated protein
MNDGLSSTLEWKFIRDNTGQLQRLISPGGKETEFEYKYFSGQSNLLNSVIRRFKSGEVIYEFDRKGRRTLMKDAAGTVCYEWNFLGLLTSVQREDGPVLEYRYDTLGRLIGYSLGTQNKIEYQYDFMGRLETMETPAGPVKYEYWTGQGKVKRTLPNNVCTFWEYNAEGRLTSITHVNPSNHLIAKFSYEYRPDGLIAAITEWWPQGERRQSFEYDKSQRLVGLTDEKGTSWQAEYDQMGNRVRGGFQGEETDECRYDWAGRPLSISGKPCEHDASGNLICATINGIERRFEYDDDNRICRAGAGEVTYEYDGDGCMIARSVRGPRTTYLPDPTTDIWRPLLETSADGRQRFFIWEDRTPLAVLKDGKPLFFLTDHLGSVRCIVDATGAVFERRDYSAFGVNTAKSTIRDMMPGFAGLFCDDVAGMYLTRARIYSAELGRFLQIDPQHRIPIGEVSELSQYAYCSCNPLNKVDRNGADEEWAEMVAGFTEFCAGLWHNVFPNTTVDRSSWFSDDYPKPPTPGETPRMYLQLNDDGTHREWLISTLQQYEKITAEGRDLSTLSRVQRQEIRRDAVERFAKDYSSDPFHKAKYDAEYIQHVANMNIATHHGILNVDWQNTIVQKGTPSGPIEYVTSHISPAMRYFIGKMVSSVIRQLGGGPLTDLRDIFPKSNLNALRVVEHYLFNSDIPFNKIFAPPPQPHTASTTWHGAVIHTVGGTPFGATAVYKAVGSIQSPANVLRKAWLQVTNNAGSGRAGFGASNTGWSNLGSPALADGILASTTGPGKRGGRGGGITWPPSWNPPGRTPVGMQPRPGGMPPPGGSGSWGGRASIAPSPVGGVYLGGAGRSLDGLGQISGIALDEKSGNLVLLTEHRGSISMPPLRLDDVVVIFRSVYLHGEGPSVSIDPLPDNPHGPVMNVVHGKATADTYVGWVLFETDRIMKCYGQGEDNVFHNKVSTRVPDYDTVLDTIYFGGNFADGRDPEGNWERFWIVPAEVTRFHANTGQLTLFDVPLKVNTQKMVLRKGKLEDDPNGQSSRGAMAFIDWFTCHYEGIAQEQYRQPPSETGLTEPVPIYAELRRIALTTAIAEQLRDQGVPMPFWMRDYQVKKVPFTKTTPSLTTQREKEEGQMLRIGKIFGGVNLSPSDSVVKNVSNAADAAKLPDAQREPAAKALSAANTLSPAVAVSAAIQPPLTPFVVLTPEQEVTAVSLPGAESTALAPCRLDEVDLEVIGEGGIRLPLVRHFNSFFQPKGELGTGWTLNLPKLNVAWIPKTRNDYGSERAGIQEIITPLNTLYARFSRVEEVAALNNVRLHVPDKPGPILAKAAADNPLVPEAESKIIFRDGRCWLFDEEGRYVAEETKPFTTVYHRRRDGNVDRISKYYGGRETVSMLLDYNEQGRLNSVYPVKLRMEEHDNQPKKTGGWLDKIYGILHKDAHGEPLVDSARRVTYHYNQDGMLESVLSPDDKVTYTYKDGLVVGVSCTLNVAGDRQPMPIVRRFEYSSNGQLAAETTADGTRMSYLVQHQEHGQRLSVGAANKETVAEYDAANRPTVLTEPDGTQTTWNYDDKGVITTETVFPSGEKSQMHLSGDGKERTLSSSDGPSVCEELDDAGHVVRLSVEKMPDTADQPLNAMGKNKVPMEEVFTQQWHPDGLPGTFDCKSHAIVPEYDEYGRLRRVMRVKPTGTNSFKEWQQTLFDDNGRVTEVKDCRGGNVAMSYDVEGNIAGLTTERDGQRFCYSFTRNQHGLLTGMKSPWSDETCEYDADGNLSSVVMKRGQAESRAEFSEGRVKRLSQFDGGNIEFDYNKEGSAKELLKAVHTPAIDLEYRYDDSGTLAEVSCGNACRVAYVYDKNGNLVSLAYVPSDTIGEKE